MQQVLRYGNNPHQSNASYCAPKGAITFVNGSPSYINLLDILTGWQMTRDVALSLGGVAAVSMKHCTPVGLAIPGQVDDFTKALMGRDVLGDAASSYLRARSNDWGAAYGDIAVIFGEVDEELADVLVGLVSDGIAATGFTKNALAKLSNKQGGRYLIAKLDPQYVPPESEVRELFGVTVTQQRNNYLPVASDFKTVVGSNQLALNSLNDFKLAIAAMKYTVSNNIVIASGGRTLSISAGQQSRILSTELACTKFKRLMLLQHPEVVEWVSSSQLKLNHKIAIANEKIATLTTAETINKSPTVLASDGFIPFTDNIELAAKFGIQIILEPDGAIRSRDIENSAKNAAMTLVRTRQRFFYH